MKKSCGRVRAGYTSFILGWAGPMIEFDKHFSKMAKIENVWQLQKHRDRVDHWTLIGTHIKSSANQNILDPY